jgi:hypothetical protein
MLFRSGSIFADIERRRRFNSFCEPTLDVHPNMARNDRSHERALLRNTPTDDAQATGMSGEREDLLDAADIVSLARFEPFNERSA